MPPITMAYDPVTTLQAVAHDREALGLFVAHEQPELLAWLERVLRDHDLAQESVQETWLILSRGEWRFAARSADAAGDVRAWLRQIALRVAFRQRQRQHSQQRQLYGWLRLNNSGAETPTPLEQLVERDRHDLVSGHLSGYQDHPACFIGRKRFSSGVIGCLYFTPPQPSMNPGLVA